MHGLHATIASFCISFSVVVAVQEAVFIKSAYTDFVCDTEPLTDFGTTGSAIACSRECGRTVGCHSFFFNKASRSCLGSILIYTNFTGCLTVMDVMYYYKGATNQGDSCASDVDCYGANVRCRGTTCMCIPGFSLQPELNTCEPGCLDYGVTYSMYPNRTLALAGSTQYTNYTVQQCMDACVISGCLTMRYNHANTDCKTDTRTPYTDPTALIAFDNIDLYMRNCIPV